MIIPTGYAQVNVKFTGAGVPRGAECAFGVHNTTAMDAVAVAGAFQDAWLTANVMFSLVNTVTASSYLVKLGPNDTGQQYEYAAPIVGGNNNPQAPPNVAWLWKKGTSLGGRHGRGRSFLPGVPEPAVNHAGVVDSAYVTQVNTELADLLSAMTARDIPMVLLHGDATSPTPVTSLTVGSICATQRRRLRK